MPRDPVERYLSKFTQGEPDSCWEWEYGRFDKGYGAFRVGDRLLKAHRFGYETFVGPIGPGLIVCHSCDNPPCQNPAHWFLGTHAVNARDRAAKGRGKTLRGTAVRTSRLTEDQVREVRALSSSGMSQRAIAERVPVDQTMISRIIRGVAWASID